MSYLKIKKDFSRESGKRNILVFLDGTWNDETGRQNDGVTTNVYKMFRMLAGTLHDDDVPHRIENDKQVALYFRGIGNDDDHGTISEHYGGIFGGGEKDIRNHAYVRIIQHFRPGDRIMIFGFSRGAACARLLANKIDVDGIPDGVRIHTRQATNRSSGKKETSFQKYSHCSDNVKKVNIQFLGLWDTVGAFGIPVNIGPLKLQSLNLFKNLDVAGNVLHGAHLVAIDENREPFVPTLVNTNDHIDEVWFPGVHSDVGGGFRKDELGKITLRYMLNSLDKAAASRPVQFIADEKDKLFEQQSSEYYLHITAEGVARSRREISVFRNDKPSAVPPKIHESVFQMMQAQSGVYLAEAFDSYIRPSRVIYAPKGINGLRGGYKVVKDP